MTHNLGRVVPDGRTFDHSSGLDLVPGPGPLGGPRFVILHFDSVSLDSDAELTVTLGYDTDVFTASSGAAFWSRPVDTSIGTIQIRITGGSGSGRLREYGSGEPSDATGGTPGTPAGSRTNPDVFLHTDPYEEPIYETRLECNPGFAWRNAACSLAPTIDDPVRERVAAATGIIVEVHDGHVSSCTGTLIAADLFITARHCLTDPTGEDRRSASVSFDYATACDGRRPSGHVTRFFKVLEEVASGSPPTGVNPPAATDWVVLRLDAAPGELPPPLPMRDAALLVGETIFTMHHPNGAAKKTQAGVHDGGSISGFDFAGGSSGSALFDASGRVIGGPLSQGSGCSVTFAPIAAIKSALGTPPAPPNPLDVMIVFDRSGSMASSAPPAGRSKLQEAQDAAALFVKLVREGQGDRIGLVTFTTTASLDAGMSPAAAAKPDLVGPPPFASGKIGAITPDALTSIGAGLGVALLAMTGSSNDRAILLLTDGLQNVAPTIEEIEGYLGSVKVNVIGFGSDAQIDGPLLDRVAREHDGHFTRAVDGLTLRKFFGLSFGNMFEAGVLSDPDFVLRADDPESAPHRFDVCGEETVTIVLGWDEPSTPLRARIYAPSGALVGDKRVQPVRGRSWIFWRICLPHQGERDGTWQLVVERVPTGGEFPPPPTDVRYFSLVVCSGGPKLVPLVRRRRVYTGDPIDPMVALHYGNRTTPHNATVELTIEAPRVALGQLAMRAGLREPITHGDPVDAFHATLQAVARDAGGALPVQASTITVPLYDDGLHDDGAIEPDGIFNHRLGDLTRVEGTYQFRAVATYGEGCKATREAHWSVHVEPAIDPGRSEVTLVDVIDGNRGTLVIVPRDPHGNPLGPGRGSVFTVSPLPGVRIPGKVKDRGDGSYIVVVVWDPAVGGPGVVVQQPDRDPVVMQPPSTGTSPPCERDCTDVAEQLLDCLGLHGTDVKKVRVRRVSLDVDLKEDDEDCGC